MNDYQLNAQCPPLTERQKSILVFIDKYRQQYGYAPTIREIGNGTGIASTSAVNYQLNRLVTGGYLARTREVSRSFVLLSAGYDAIGKVMPNECELSGLRAEVAALQSKNRRILEQYEACLRILERE